MTPRYCTFTSAFLFVFCLFSFCWRVNIIVHSASSGLILFPSLPPFSLHHQVLIKEGDADNSFFFFIAQVCIAPPPPPPPLLFSPSSNTTIHYRITLQIYHPHTAQGSLEWSHDPSTHTGQNKPSSRRPLHGVIEAGTLVGHMGLMYSPRRKHINRLSVLICCFQHVQPRARCDRDDQGWCRCMEVCDGQLAAPRHPWAVHDATTAGARVCVFEDARFSSPFFRFDLIFAYSF